MNVLSLCDGMSCGQIALKELGIQVDHYYASEIDKNAIKVTQDNFPDTIQLGDVNGIDGELLRTLQKIDLVMFGSPCFVGDSMVLTSNGYRMIKDVQIGDYVLSHDNKFHIVTKQMCTGIKQIWEVKCMGSEVIKTTSNHKFYIRHKIKKWNNDKRLYDISFSNPKWVEVKDLDNKCFVGYAINNEAKLPKWSGIDYWKQWKIHHKNELNLNDKQFWYLAGRFLGDGWVRKNYKKGKFRLNKYNGVIICCNKNELEDLKSKIGNVFNYNVQEEMAVYKLQISDTELSMFLSQFGTKSYNKQFLNL